MASLAVVHKNQRSQYFVWCIVVLALILVGVFRFNNLIRFYIAFEASLIPTVVLILRWGYQPERLQARTYLMLYTVMASLPLLLSIILIFSTQRHLRFLIHMNLGVFGDSGFASVW